MAQIGTYCNGDPYVLNPPGGGGVRIGGIAPVCATDGARVMHGTMAQNGGGNQGFDSAPNIANTTFRGYSAALNIDPGTTGSPIVIAPSEEIAIIKSISQPTSKLNGTDNRNRIGRFGTLTVVTQAPPAGAFRPGLTAPSKVSRWVEDDVNFDKLRNLPVPRFDGELTALRLSRSIRWQSNTWDTDNGAASSVSAVWTDWDSRYNATVYRRIADALVLINCDIHPTVKRDLVVGLVQRGIDVHARLESGGNFNNGNGGHALMKGYIALAALLLDSADMAAHCDPANGIKFVEDFQHSPINQEDIDRSNPSASGVRVVNYPANSLGGPEWKIDSGNWTSSRRGSEPASTYRRENSNWQMGVALAFTLMSGGRDVWAHPVFFDYADRLAERDWFPGEGPTGYGMLSTYTHSPTPLQKDAWTAYRSTPGMPPVWDWPAP